MLPFVILSPLCYRGMQEQSQKKENQTGNSFSALCLAMTRKEITYARMNEYKS